MKQSIFIAILIAILNPSELLSQRAIKNFNFIGSDNKETEIINSIVNISKYKLENFEKIKNIAVFQLNNSGYIEAKSDTYFINNNIFTIKFFLGNRYVWKNLFLSEEVQVAMETYGKNHNFKARNDFTLSEIESIHEQILTYYENNGYPFASTKLENIFISENFINATMVVEKGNFIKIDTIIFLDNSLVSPYLLYNSIEIMPRDIYNESKIKQIEKNINNLDFLKVNNKVDIIFSKNSAILKIGFTRKNSNTFDGIIGFMTDNITGKVALNGNVVLKLVNLFKNGESFEFNWIRPPQNNQTLDLKFMQPYLYKTNFGINYMFHLYRQDTAYISVINRPAITYHFGLDKYISAFAVYNTNQRTNIGNESLSNINNSSITFGIGAAYTSYNYNINPRRGFGGKINLEAGNKKIANNIILGNQIPSNSNKAIIYFSGEVFIPIFSKSTIRILNESASLVDSYIFDNELYRIGGFKSLRGFDEESIRASTFSIFNAEYRILIQQNSNIAFFYNMAYVEKKTLTAKTKDYSKGFGAGINVDTGSGIFSFYYALGSENGNKITLRNSKIHFGYLVKF